MLARGCMQGAMMTAPAVRLQGGGGVLASHVPGAGVGAEARQGSALVEQPGQRRGSAEEAGETSAVQRTESDLSSQVRRGAERAEQAAGLAALPPPQQQQQRQQQQQQQQQQQGVGQAGRGGSPERAARVAMLTPQLSRESSATPSLNMYDQVKIRKMAAQGAAGGTGAAAGAAAAGAAPRKLPGAPTAGAADRPGAVAGRAAVGEARASKPPAQQGPGKSVLGAAATSQAPPEAPMAGDAARGRPASAHAAPVDKGKAVMPPAPGGSDQAAPKGDSGSQKLPKATGAGGSVRPKSAAGRAPVGAAKPSAASGPPKQRVAAASKPSTLTSPGSGNTAARMVGEAEVSSLLRDCMVVLLLWSQNSLLRLTGVWAC